MNIKTIDSIKPIPINEKDKNNIYNQTIYSVALNTIKIYSIKIYIIT